MDYDKDLVIHGDGAIAPPELAAPGGTAADEGGAKAPASLPFRTGPDVFENVPPTTFLAPYIPEAALVEITGLPKEAGKTTFVLSLTAALLRGGPFLGAPTVRTPVVYLSEQSPSSFAESARRAGLDTADGLHVLHAGALRRLGLSWEEVFERTLAHAVAVGARVVFVDTLPAFAQASDENSSAESYRVCGPLLEAPMAGVTVVVIRHEKKGGGSLVGRARGSTAYTAQWDVVAGLSRVPKAPGHVRLLEVDGRYGDHRDYVAFDGATFDLVDDPTSPATQALAVLRDSNTALTAAEVADRMKARGCSFGENTVRKALNALVECGDAEDRTLPGTGSPKGYTAT